MSVPGAPSGRTLADPAALDPPWLRPLVFSGLAAFCAAHWLRLLVNPPVGRAVVALAIIGAGACVLALLGRAQMRRGSRWVLAALASLASIAGAMAAMGMPAHLVAPGAWDELGDRLDHGLAGIGDGEYPYAGGNEWSRLVLLLGLVVLLAIAAVLAFWPARGYTRRLAALAVLVGTFATAAALEPPPQPLLMGLALLALTAAWLWPPGVARRSALAGGALVALAGLLAMPLAARLDADDPWLAYRSWTWSPARGVGFNWNHRYGPLDWPRDGETMFDVRSDAPHYWRAAVLERFDGFRWVISDAFSYGQAEVPSEAERAPVPPPRTRRWTERADIAIGSLRSPFVLSSGAVRSVDGIGSVAGPGGLIVTSDRLEGTTYTVRSYTPDPGAARMRAAPRRYPERLVPYTEFEVPIALDELLEPLPDSPGPARPDRTVNWQITPPLFGQPGEQRRLVAHSPYGRVYDLARRLTGSAPNVYEAVKAVERYLGSGYTYGENVPRHRHPLPAFLFEERVGYCQHFAGAMALMLRMGGIPSRVVGGFSPGTPVAGAKDVYEVTDLDAHSWVEVYFRTIGWVPFDPTPGTAPAGSQAFGPRGRRR